MLRRLTTIGLLAVLGAAHAQDPADNPVKRVAPAGTDGAQTNYVIFCKNTTVTSVIVDDQAGQTCAVRPDGSKTCQADWPVAQSAVSAYR